MLTGVRRLGHAIPPIFVVSPLGLLSASVIFDFLELVSGGRAFGEIAYWLILSGLTGGIAMAILGTVDRTMLPSGSREKARATVHLIAYVAVLAIYGASAYVRDNDSRTPEVAAMILATLGTGIALFGATVGAELVGTGRPSHDASLHARRTATADR